MSKSKVVKDEEDRNPSYSKVVAINMTKKDVGIQTEIIPKDYVPPKVLSTFTLESEAFPKIFYQPHLIFLLLLAIIALAYTSFNMTESPLQGNSYVTNSRL